MNKRNFWVPCVTTIVLACASNAFRTQTSYRVTDLGREEGSKMRETPCPSMMKAGRRSWPGTGIPTQNINFIGAQLASGHVLIGADGLKFDLGVTLGGKRAVG